MKKILISVIIVLVLVLTCVTIIKGISIGNLKILGISEIKKQNEKLDTTVKQATKLASTDYPAKEESLEDENKKMKETKEQYEDMVNVSTDSQVETANQSSTYMMDFLWIRIENHAKSEGVTIDMDVSRSGGDSTYNLNFTAKGTYTGIEEFITGIEDDTKLGFKIENFSMSSSSEDGNQVQATFMCKDIKIQGISDSAVSTTDTSATKGNTTSENTTTGNTTSEKVDSSTKNNTTK